MPRLASNKGWRYKPCVTSATFYGRSSTRSTSPTWNRDGLHPERSGSRLVSMAPPEDSSRPHLAAGCRWGGSEEDRVILFPEGAIKLQGTGRQVLEHCAGERTFGQIIGELQAQFGDADPVKIRADISQFLEQLRHKRIV